MNASKARPAAAFVAATSLTFLKPRLKKNLQPWAAYLARPGITASPVTITSLIGSVVVGGLLCVSAAESGLFAILPAWLVTRTACATIDGTLAIDFGQKSRLGGIFNETGDIISEIALVMPLMFSPFSITTISLLIALFVASELAGITPTMAGGDRRLEGPLGKIDRSIILSAIAIVIAIFGRLPESASIVVPVLSVGAIATICNRVRFAIHETAAIAGRLFCRRRICSRTD
jgi:CDP-diacylglycerol---glycerol-3-phosphate 3-phosphatidyltransferase